ncbi:MAG: hypothetical protein QGI21_03510 [Candidatus Poseidoniaceae archaeon]|nr:hypothetical protein [Candidatus Poseidoniaceae archaeon]
MRSELRVFIMLFVLLFSTMAPLLTHASAEDDSAWDPYSQPWAQYGRDPGHMRIAPDHGDNGLATIETPAVNWVAFDSGLGADGYGVAIANLSNSITSPEGARERCGEGHLFAVMTRTDSSSGERHLTIIEGDSAKIAWDVNLGEAPYIRSTPIIVDVDGDGMVEIALAYDTNAALKVDLWAPQLSCDESGWSSTGHSNERLWSYTDADLRIGITSPHWFTSQSNHYSVTQPLLADLALDGSPEIVLAVVNTQNDEPTVLALPLGLQSPEEEWSVALDRGTHPSDPAFAALDENSGAVVLTTVDSNNGNMWIWRIDGETGSLDWERVSIQGTDSDSDTPRLRLPGPVITQLDSDDAPEMILTLPVDDNGATEGMGAQYVGMELTSTNELWRFRSKNGYGDAEPVSVDTDGDGITDRVCWVTWYSDSSFSTDREGSAGCHDITIDPPFREWSRNLQRGSGNDNDEIAVAAPIVLDLDGEDEPELIVAFGRRIFAFDGDTGTPADIGTGWSAPIDVPHRVWASPAVADMDGDGYLDILVGDALISEALSDVSPLADGRGIGFTPNDPDPGEMVTISGQFSNIGIVDTDEPVDAVLVLDGIEIKRFRTNTAEAVAPSGEGGPITFSVSVEATLGVHNVDLILDPNNNLSQSRDDNDNYSTTLTVLEPYVATIMTPSEVPRALPGANTTVDITITSIGSRSAAWTLSLDDTTLPSGWSFTPLDSNALSLNLDRDVPQNVQFDFQVPPDAIGSDDGVVQLTLTLDQDQNITTVVNLPLEVERTRGLSLQGASGLPSAIGYGRPGDDGHVWILVENVGNAQETTEMQWSSNTWGSDTRLVNSNGQTQWGIELGPSEMKEFLIQFEVPSNKNLGDSSSTTLTLCIGSGSEEICEDFEVTMFASDVASSSPHIRTVPASELSWEIAANLPPSGEFSWDMGQAGMLKEGWNWTATGGLIINGSNLELTSQTGMLHLDLPVNTPPNRHFFNQSEANNSYADIAISLHVLQVFRASAAIIEPNNGSVLNVSEETKLILQLENPGNGEDTFLLEGNVGIGNLSAHPDVEFTINNPLRTLGPGAIAMVPVWVNLSEDIAAREQFELIFNWTSQGDVAVSDSAIVIVEARPDHRWDYSIAGGMSQSVIPGQELSIPITITNVGNTDDELTLNPSFNVIYSGMDTSIWQSNEIVSSILDVNQNETLYFNMTVPDDCWADTIIEVNMTMSSANYTLEQTLDLELTVDRVSGWRFDLTNVSLEVPPEGGIVSVKVEQLGNAPSEPHYLKSSQGWQITYPTNNSIINPGDYEFVSFNVTPPEDAIAGQVGVVAIRISDGNGDGAVIEQIPVRVGASPGIIIDSRDSWYVREGVDSWPTAWIENTGNDVAIINLSIQGLPNNWITNGEGLFVISPGQISGVPIQIQPDSNWNGNNLQINIIIEHPTLGIIAHQIVVSSSEDILASSPVATGRTGDKVSISIDSNNSGITTAEIELSEGRNNVSHSGLSLHLIGISAPIHSSECTNTNINSSSLGVIPLSVIWSSCLVTANADYDLNANAWLRTDRGEIIDQSQISISAGDNVSINLSMSNWDGEPGPITIETLIVDSNGLVLYSNSKSYMVRDSGWNLKINSLKVDENSIDVSIGREGYAKMGNTVCTLEISQLSGTWSHRISLDVTEGVFPPSYSIERPSEIEEGDEISASISCLEPWDLDTTPNDNTKSTFASKVPTITYESSDVYWTIGIAFTMLILAWFTGILTRGNEGRVVVRKKTQRPVKEITKPLPEVPMEEEKEIEIDDISFDLDEDVTDDPIEEETPEEDVVIDIDDGSASGRLSALRKEMVSDGDIKSEGDISKRLDKFLNDR